MKIENIGGHRVEIFESIEDLPVLRFHKYNKMQLIDSGVGSDTGDVMHRIEKAIRFCRVDPEKAADELFNLRQAIHLINNEISPKMLSFAALVKSIDGEECSDISDEGLGRTLEKLKFEKVGVINEALEASKKK